MGRLRGRVAARPPRGTPIAAWMRLACSGAVDAARAGARHPIRSPTLPRRISDIDGARRAGARVSGSPRAAPVIDALRDGKLFAWNWPRPDTPLFIRTDKGFVDARTGAPVDVPVAGESAAGHRQRYGARRDRRPRKARSACFRHSRRRGARRRKRSINPPTRALWR